MLRQMFSFFGDRSEKPDPAERPATRRGASPEPPVSPSNAEERTPSITPEACRFYLSVVSDEEPADLQDLPPDDRVFISGVIKRLREKRLEVPVLPRAALEISRLLSQPNSSASDFAKILEADPALSVDVLRIANSAFYGVGQSTNSVRRAVVRIGLSQLRGLIIVNQLNGKVLQSGSFRREAEWLSDLSLATAHLAHGLASDLRLPPNAAFTRGMLLHVEHFVIMGAVSDVCKDQRRKIQPTEMGLREGILRFGPQVRELAAREWALGELLVDSPASGHVSNLLVQLRRALVAAWTGEELPTQLDAITPDRLAGALRAVTRKINPAGSE